METRTIETEDGWNSHRLAASLIADGSRVLDVGCGSGFIARLLHDRGCRVVGVEPDPRRRERAAPWCERVVDGVAEGLDSLGLEPAAFDVVLFADVLEHLPDPWGTLRAALAYLKPGGRVVISLPNFANFGARVNLMRGRFRYEGGGLYDRTHLRFFTRETLQELVESAGLRVADWQYTLNFHETGPMRAITSRMPRWRGPLRRLDRALTYRWCRLFAFQFVIACERREEEPPGVPESTPV